MPAALVCDKCHALVYSERLERLAEQARALEASGDLHNAREIWLSGLPLLPPNSTQASWITEHARSLEPPIAETLFAQTVASQSRRSIWERGVVGLGFLVSFAAFVAIYWKAEGAQFGVGFAVLILIHEMGHYVDIRRRGLPADMPLFLPGVGAYVRWRAMGVSLQTRAEVSLAGPLAGFLAALACAVFWWQTHEPYWLVLARVGAALNLLNLIPIWILDGGQAALALAKSDRILLLVALLVLWAVLHENIFLPVAAGAVYRAFFSPDLPARPSRATLVYFFFVLAALGLILHVLPGHGLSAQ